MTWKPYYSKNVSVQDSDNGGFTMTLSGDAEPHYILRGGAKFATAKSIQWGMAIDLTPDSAVIKATEGTSAAAGTVILTRAGDNLSGVGKYADYRLWSGANRIFLVEGSFVAECPMVASSWTNVNGQQPSSSAFKGLLANIAKVGVTFGGMFFGHGVLCKGGSAKITVTKFKPT